MEFSEGTKEKNGKWQEFVEYCLDLFDKFKKSEYREEKIKSIQEAYRVYKQKENLGHKIWDGASNTELPLVTITVDNLEPRMVASLTGKKPFVNFEMEGLTEKDPITEIIEDWFNTELEYAVDIEDVASKVTHRLLLEGDIYPIPYYDEDETVTKEFVFDEVPVLGPDGQPQVGPGGPITQKQLSIGEDGEPATQEVTEIKFRGCRVKFAEFNDVYTSDEDIPWEEKDVIRIVRPTYAYLQRHKDATGYMNIGDWLLNDEVKEKDEDAQSPEETVDNKKVTGRDVIECLECSVRFVDESSWDETRYVGWITKESGILIRIMKLVDLNFSNEHIIKNIRIFKDGSSIYDKMRSIQRGSTDLFNMVVNVATVCMIPWFLYTDAAGLDGEAKIVPGQGIRVDDVTQVSFPKFSQNPRSYMIFIEMFMGLWEKLGSVSDIQVGRISEGSKDVTATETMAAIQEGNIKHNYQGISLKRDFVSLVRTIYDLYYKNMPMDATFTFRGQKIPVPRSEMRRKFKFRIVGSTDMSNKVLEMKKTEGIYKLLANNPIANQLQLTEDLVHTYNADADPKKYVNPMSTQFVMIAQKNPEIMQVIQQYLQQKQQGAQKNQQEQQMNMATQTGKTIANAMMNKNA